MAESRRTLFPCVGTFSKCARTPHSPHAAASGRTAPGDNSDSLPDQFRREPTGATVAQPHGSHPGTYMEPPGHLPGATRGPTGSPGWLLWVLPRAPETNRELRWNLLRLDRNVSETFPECLTRCLRRVSGTTATTCCFRGVLDSLRDLSDSIPRPFRQLDVRFSLAFPSNFRGLSRRVLDSSGRVVLFPNWLPGGSPGLLKKRYSSEGTSLLLNLCY